MRAIGPLVLACLVLGCAMTQRMNVAVAEGSAEGTLGGAPATRFDMMKRFHDETTRYTTWAVCRGSELWTFSYLAPETEAVELERAQQQLVRTVVWR
jgi:hypothetical protein